MRIKRGHKIMPYIIALQCYVFYLLVKKIKKHYTIVVFHSPDYHFINIIILNP